MVAVRALRPGGATWRRAAPTASAPRSGPPTTWPPTWCAATSRRGPPPAQPELRPVPGRPGGGAVRGPHRTPAGALARLAEEAACERGDVDEYRDLVPGRPPRRRAPTRRRRRGVDFALSRLDARRRGRGRRPAAGRAVGGLPQGRGGPARASTTAATRSASASTRSTTRPAPRPPRPAPALQPNNRAFQHRGGRPAAAGSADPPAAVAPTPGRPGDRPPPARPSGGAGTPPGARLPRPRPPRPGAGQLSGSRRELDDMRRDRPLADRVAGPPVRPGAALLEAWGYLDGWALTERGEVLARTYHESDLLVAEAMAAGCSTVSTRRRWPGWCRASPTSTAGRAAAAAVVPVPAGAAAGGDLERMADELRADEEAAGLPRHPGARPRLLALAHAWAAGEPLGEVLGDEDLSGGDFVRNVKTLIDLVRQVGDVAPNPATAQRPARRPTRCTGAWCRSRRRSTRSVGEPGRRDLGPTWRPARRARDRPAGEAWGERGRPRPGGVVVASDAEPAGSSRPGGPGEPVPAAGPARRRPVPHGGRRRRRHPAAGPRRPRLPVDLGLGPGRRAPALVRRPPGGAAVVVAGPDRGRHERRVPGRLGRRPPAHPNDGLLDVFDVAPAMPPTDRLKARRPARRRAPTPAPSGHRRRAGAGGPGRARPSPPGVARRRAGGRRPPPVDPRRARRPRLRRVSGRDRAPHEPAAAARSPGRACRPGSSTSRPAATARARSTTRRSAPGDVGSARWPRPSTTWTCG